MAISHRSGGLGSEPLLAFEVPLSQASAGVSPLVMSSNTPLDSNAANIGSGIDTDSSMDSTSNHNIDTISDNDTDSETEHETHGETEREIDMLDIENGGQRPEAWTMGLYSTLEKLVVKAKGAASKPVVKFIKK